MMHELICKIYGSVGACPESVCFGGGRKSVIRAHMEDRAFQVSARILSCPGGAWEGGVGNEKLP